jgi:succinyl-CoA synthetase beta subunit
MFGNHLVTNQTNQSGIKIDKVYVEQLCKINREIYLSISADRKTAKIIVLIGILGGINIENSSKDKIITHYIDIMKGCPQDLGQKIANNLDLKEKEAAQFNDILQKCYKLFIVFECSLLEINPLIIDKNGNFFALDAKLSFDDNALFRHLELKELVDEKAENPLEKTAKENGISYVSLDDGQIGCLVNGAGLAMATMDIIKYFGAKPANFLDIGGGAPKERVVKALEIILEDKRVKAILINIFGGIMRCDILAQGLIDAVNQIGIKIPIVVRLKGTNEDIGKNILKESGLDFIAADDLDDAAQKVLKAALRG